MTTLAEAALAAAIAAAAAALAAERIGIDPGIAAALTYLACFLATLWRRPAKRPRTVTARQVKSSAGQPPRTRAPERERPRPGS